MSISLKTHKMLWGRAANRCAFPDCRQELIMDPSEADEEALFGEECHIIAQEPNGPRGDHQLSPEARDKYSNLILLCSNHHTIIDKQPITYTIQYLKEIKSQHEKWVKESLTDFDPIKQKDDERYATYTEEWINLAGINHWKSQMEWLFIGDQPRIYKDQYQQMIKLEHWLLSRIWPKRYDELEKAFDTFRLILRDLRQVFDIESIYFRS